MTFTSFQPAVQSARFGSQVSFSPKGNELAGELDALLAKKGIQKVPHWASPMTPIIFYYPATQDQVEPLMTAFKQALNLPAQTRNIKYKNYTISVLWKPPTEAP